MSRAVVLLSGGLDSATALAIARDEGYETYALSVRYGQRHEAELAAAARVAVALGARRHLVVSVDLGAIGGSALIGEAEVPKDQPIAEIGAEIPVTYVPARNTVFLSLALAWAEVLEAEDVFMGVTAVDYSGYPDCRPEYIHAYEAMGNLATKAAVEGRQHLRIHAPLIDLDKAAIIRLGSSLGVDYGVTSSCYDPAADGAPCGRCDACLLRLEGFRQAGLADPLRYPVPE